MEDLLVKVMPYLETFRGWIMSLAEILSRLFELQSNNVYTFLLVVISLWVSKKILEFFYSTLEGRRDYWIILAAALFWLLKFVGAN